MSDAARPHCHACAYDLSGLDLPAHCPECGEGATVENVDAILPWPTAGALARRMLWPGALAPLLVPAWVLEKPLGVLASALLLLAVMFVPVTVGGSICVDCCVPKRRDGAFLKMLAVGWGVNGVAWTCGALLGYALAR